MRALTVSGFDRPPELRDISCPDPGPGEAKIRVAACGLNFADLLMSTGRYQATPNPPFVLGLEAIGTVLATGPGVVAPEPGTRVAVFAGQGGLAEEAVVPVARCRPVPATLDDVTGAGFQVAYGTAHLALTRRARLTAGETLLVLGAAGGVGLAAVEVGKALGARVVASARGADRLTVARDAGADHLIDAEADLKSEMRALGGADVIFDPVGGDAFRAALSATRPEARAIVIGFAAGDVQQIPANHLLVKNVDVIGFYWGAYLDFAPEALGESLDTLVGWHAEGRLKPHVSHVLPLDRAAEGLEMLRARQATGKVVITM